MRLGVAPRLGERGGTGKGYLPGGRRFDAHRILKPQIGEGVAEGRTVHIASVGEHHPGGNPFLDCLPDLLQAIMGLV